MNLSDLRDRACLYSQTRNRAIQKPLGDGTDGGVWQTDKKTAVKACFRKLNYDNEKNCYRIFYEKGITDIYGFAIPKLIDFDDHLLVVEMNIVRPPYILDFGKVYLHRQPAHFSRETMADWYDQQKETWGKHWPTVQKILHRLQSLGIYHFDPRPKNILPANWDPDMD